MRHLLYRVAVVAATMCAVALGATPSGCAGSEDTPIAQRTLPSIAVSQLPREARATLQAIARGGPFPYEHDGAVFGNFEKRLPLKGRGYYREYTVPTPGVRHRGARRIVAGREGEHYYTDDHYRSFKRVIR